MVKIALISMTLLGKMSVIDVVRWLKKLKGGQFKFDFPDLKKTVPEFDDRYMIRLVYGSYKNEYARHKWGYTRNTIKKLFNKWYSLDFKDIVKHDYPMQGVIATK